MNKQKQIIIIVERFRLELTRTMLSNDHHKRKYYVQKLMIKIVAFICLPIELPIAPTKIMNKCLTSLLLFIYIHTKTSHSHSYLHFNLRINLILHTIQMTRFIIFCVCLERNNTLKNLLISQIM